MTWVKICGMTNVEDALLAVEAGADAVGFVFYEKSPRNVTVDQAAAIVKELPESVEKVGVFVGHSSDDWVDAVRSVGLTAIQHYPFSEPSHSSNQAKAIGPGIFARRMKYFVALPAEFFLDDQNRMTRDLMALRNELERRPPLRAGCLDTFFLDSGNSQTPGGTGKPFHWSKAASNVEALSRADLKLVVAGGLTPENVTEPIRILKPWGVDVASGVEASAGKKDPEKVRAFVKAVREADKKVI